MHQLFVLFENASGYALFRTTEFEEIGIFLPQVQRSILDVSKFRSIVFLVAFHSFKKGEALDNMKCISEGKLHMDLQLFLENNVPQSKKSKQAVVLGIDDKDLASAITETLGITCSTSGVVHEILRGIRFHFHKLVKGYKDLDIIIKAQQALGHHYSRAKMNVNVNKFDSMVTQSVGMLDQLSKDINTLTLRLREWYSFHFPELIKIVPNMELYIQCVKEIKNRNNMPENIEEVLFTILQDKDKVQRIQEASRSSMGMDISVEDIENIERFIDQIMSLMKRQNELTQHLGKKMHLIAPNLTALIGESVGARLITQAGSLTSLAKLPASTVQILGAGKSLFKVLKRKSKKAPKFGTLNQSIIGKSGKTAMSKMSRLLANKCCLASRIDCFSVVSTNEHGLKLKEIVDSRRNFYENGKFAAEFNPGLFEKKKEALLAKKMLLRKKKRERKRRKQMIYNGLDSKKTETAKTNGTLDNIEVSNQVLTDKAVNKRPTRNKRKAKELSEVEESGESQNVDESQGKVKPKRKKRQSVRNLKR